MDATTTCKACTKCFQIKPLEAFHRNASGQYGRSSWCAKCHLDHQRRYKARQKAERAEDGDPQSLARRGHRIAWQSPAGIEREAQAQEVALLGADLARLRKALDEWWKASADGFEIECGAPLLAVRVILRSAAERDRAIQRRRK